MARVRVCSARRGVHGPLRYRLGMAGVAAEQQASTAAGQAAAVEESSLALVEMTVAALATSGQLSVLQLRVLLVVDRHGPLNLSALASALELSVPSASRLIDRLVTAGLVRRGVAAHSRREVQLVVTPKGRRALGELRVRRQRAIAAVLERMSPGERADLVSGLEAFARVAEA